MKAFDEILSLFRRYAPTLIAHLLLVVGLSLLVLDTAQLPDGAKLWKTWSGDVDKVLKSVGIDAKAWYVIAGLALAYLTLFQWLCRAITSLPILRARSWSPYDADLLSWACQVLKIEPIPHTVEQALDYQVTRALERVRQAGQSHPYQFVIDQRLFVTGWYGNVLIFLVGAAAWLALGAPYAQSVGHVTWTLVALAAGAVGLRWYVQQLLRRQRNGAAWWVLDQLAREATAGTADQLASERRREIVRRLDAEAQGRRTPARLILAVATRLPPWPRRWIIDRINHPTWSDDLDWQLATAQRSRHGPDGAPTAAALDTAPFEPRFRALLEREGSGLAILTPAHAGLALVEGGGSVYSFLNRRHDHSGFGLALHGGERLDDDTPRLLLLTGGAEGFAASLGPAPIEKLVAGVSPPIPWEAWRRFRWDTDEAPWLKGRHHDRKVEVEGVTVALEQPLVFGDSYVLALRTQSGAVARILLQAFRIEASERVLIAWCVHEVDTPRAPKPTHLPWTKPAAWKGLWRAPKTASQS